MKQGVTKFKKNGEPDMRFTSNRVLFCDEGKNIDGSPDLRQKRNNDEFNKWIMENCEK